MDNQLELVKEFEDEACTVAFHPSGFHIIAAFNDKILMLNIFENDLVPFKEIHIKVAFIIIKIKQGCKEIQFSHGGHLFAIANSNIV